ncbi:hypothetical protein [Fodinibius sp.]|uniref:hypothetical protein n=1 Tax=Fodinibius sp. TaxID=1872440 RepID=UPI002ACEE6A3|nr:hypothetical protein [Fodinibius sp.]MDZ7658066.1 hypothetical protein [Fodinibius sp.]
MASRKRKRKEIDRDRKILSEWLAMGKTDEMSQTAMAEELRQITNADYTLSQQQISYDLTYIEKEWKESRIENVHKAKMRELEKLKGYERMARKGWDRSIKEKEKHKRKVKNEAGERTKEIQVETEDPIGDPRFINSLVKISKHRAKIMGFEAAQKHEVTGKDGGPVEITEVVVEMPEDNEQ